MKYRLLKEIDQFPKDSVFRQHGDMYLSSAYGFDMTVPKQLVEQLSDWFAPIDERWKPKFGEEYFSISGNGDCYEDRFTDSFWHKERHAFGNCFKTVAEAQAAALRVKELLLSIHKEN